MGHNRKCLILRECFKILPMCVIWHQIESFSKSKQPAKNSNDIEVIISQDNPQNEAIEELRPIKDSLKKSSSTDADFEDIKKRLGNLEKGQTGPTLGQTEFMREVEILSDENQRLWRTLTSLEEQFKNVSKQAGIKVKGGQDSGKVSFHPFF